MFKELQTKMLMKKIVKTIQKYHTVICLRHKDPDPDAIGSQHGLANIIKTTFPSKQIFCVGENNPSLDWMGTSDTIDPSVYKKALVIVTDCPDLKRISTNHLSDAKEIIKIDHHPLVDKFADLAWIDPKKSSASEMICDLCFSTKLRMNYDGAKYLYAGVVGDTGRFMFPGSTSNTFVDVAKLAKFGINMSKINRMETMTDINTTHLYGYLDLHLHLLPNGTAYYVLTKQLMKKFGITPKDFVSKNLPGNIKGVVAWAMFTEADNNVLKISFRSHAPSINKLATKYNGGGHALASGAEIHNNTNTQANVKKVVRDLSNVVDKYNQNNK